jgi:hypothetical protein
MQLEYAFLADAAQASEGKLFVLGGGIDRIFAQSFPAIHSHMTLVLKIELHPAECGREHNLEVELWDPDGTPIGGKLSGTFSAERPNDGSSAFVQVVLDLFNQAFPQPGNYGFQILADGQLLKSMSLRLVKRSEDEPNKS